MAYLQWEQDWGSNVPTLLTYYKNTGKMPETLKNMPSLPDYYEELLQHFYILSRSRTYYSELRPTKKGGMYSVRQPNPIDIQTILSYNQSIVKFIKDVDFLHLIQSLDELHLIKSSKR